MRFRDRTQAAELLARKLDAYRDTRPLVLGIPRGSVPMARIVAEKLDGQLDIVLVHKIGAPGNPEYAIGSVSEFGDIYAGPEMERWQLDPLAWDEIGRLRKRRAAYRPWSVPVSPTGRNVIIVDDGIATGHTALAAIRAIRSQNPARLVLATPVAAPLAASNLRAEVDELVILQEPADFHSVGQFYENFEQVTDAEVEIALREGPSGRVVAA